MFWLSGSLVLSAGCDHEEVANITPCTEPKVCLMLDPFGGTFGGDAWMHLEVSMSQSCTYVRALYNTCTGSHQELVRIHACDFIAQNHEDIGRVAW